MLTKYIKRIAVGVVAMTMLNSCQEQIDEGARFTFVGNTIATYLQSLPECSDFVEILTKGECIGLMKAYGQYTCFAPTNEAIARFLFEQDSIYWASVKKHEENPEMNKIIETIHSPVEGQPLTLKDLTNEECGDIARNHILPRMYMLGDFMGNSLPEANMNDRDLTLDLDSIDGMPLINSTAKIIEETEVENGVVHKLAGVVNPSSLKVPTLMNDYGYFSIFFEALNKTGYAEVLEKSDDKTYTEGDKIVLGIRDTQQAPYPATRRYGFTVFLETNAILKKAGVTDFASLEKKCKEWYPDGMLAWRFNEEKKDWDPIKVSHHDTVSYTSPCHPVNQFIGYHILDRKVGYENLVCYNIKANGNGFEFYSEDDFPNDVDRTEYYVTMNNRILKVTMPRGENSGSDFGKIFLNYAEQGKGQNILVYSPNKFKGEDKLHEAYNPEALNGALNVIDEVLLYKEDLMRDYVLKCIMRFDVSAICSELTNNRIRWKSQSQLNSDGDVYIPHNYCDRVKVYTDDTRLFYLAPHTAWHNYQGDEMMALGFFDFAYCLPPLPDGTYEIRMGYSASGERHVVQVYLDNEVTGLPIDLRLTGESPMVNWKHDTDDLEDDEERIAANDKDMKNRGYLKGPTTFYDNEKGLEHLARYSKLCLRAVIATKYLTGNSSHWLRFKNVNDGDDGKAQFMHDYFEIVPITYLRDESITVAERRK